MKINVENAVYNEKTGEAIIHLSTDNGNTSNVSVDFKKLLSLSNIASEDAVDFFLFSTSIYGIDRFISRRANSVDGWSRELEIKFPVRNVEKWNQAKETIKEMVSFLTGDYWNFKFYQSTFSVPDKLPLEKSFKDNFSKVSLFSGGLDSLIGLIDFLNATKDEKIILASHYDGDMKGVRGDQEALLPILIKKYPERIAYIPAIKVTLDNSTTRKEKTFRARSILFIGIALIMADAKKINIEVPENGTVSLNFPLNPSRRSACSTRTTHPNLIDLIQQVWRKLGIRTVINNPFEFLTKGEMVSRYETDNFAKQVFLKSNSCGKRRPDQRRNNPDAKHCGVCMPCIYRRASMDKIGLDKDIDYGDQINGLNFFSKKGQDVGACLEFLKLLLTHKEIKQELMISGVKNLSKINEYANLVERTRLEVKEWVNKKGNNYIKEKAGLK